MTGIAVINVADPLYQSYITYLVGGSLAGMYELIRARHGEDAVLYNKDTECGPARLEEGTAGTDGMQFHVNTAETEHFYVWLERPEISQLWHETMHLVFDVLFCRGVEYADECEDAYAYWGAAVFAKAYEQVFQTA